MSERTCIVTRTVGEDKSMIRFVAGPDGMVVADLKRRLPGRGCWVLAQRERVEQAVKRNLFRRALKQNVSCDDDLAQNIDNQMKTNVLGTLGLARKSGDLVLGAAQVETSVRSGQAALVLHAYQAAEDGRRKLDQARRATEKIGGPKIGAYTLFEESEMSLALGGINVIHAALLNTKAGQAALKRIEALVRYRGNEDGMKPMSMEGHAQEAGI